jgi:hypothetical protein
LVNLSKVLLHETLLAIFTNKSTPAEISLHIKMDPPYTNLLAGVHRSIYIHFTQHPTVVFYLAAGRFGSRMDLIFS